MKRHLDRVMRELRADRRKAGAMGALLLLGLLLWGRLLIVRNVPQVATAGPGARVEVVEVDAEEGDEGVAARPKRVVYLDLPSGMSRDLFSLRGRGSEARPVPRTGTKSPPEATDKESRSAALLLRVAEMRLQSVLLSPRPRAVISDTILKPGDTFRDMTLIKVAERHVLLESDGIVIRLRM